MITPDVTAEDTEAQRRSVPCQGRTMNNREKLTLNEHSVPKVSLKHFTESEF